MKNSPQEYADELIEKYYVITQSLTLYAVKPAIKCAIIDVTNTLSVLHYSEVADYYNEVLTILKSKL